MPNLPLPSGEIALMGGDVSVSSEEDVLAEFPRKHRRPSVAPVRDAIVAAYTEGFKEYQNIAARAAALCDPTRVTGEALRDFALEHSVIPGAGESEESVRNRLFVAPDLVSPFAVRSKVNEILADFSDTECQISEIDLDGWFVHDSSDSVWDSFIGADPEYPDRYYEDQPWMLPGGAVPSWGYPRSFVMRIPPLEENDATVSYALADEDGIFVGDGTDTSGAESDGSVAFSVFNNPKTSDELYKLIVGIVESIKGQGISWSLIVDPTL